MISENKLTEEVKNKLNRIKDRYQIIDTEDLVYSANAYTSNFKNLWTINTAITLK